MKAAALQSLEDPGTIRAMVQNLRQGIYITSRSGDILDANPAFLAMFGLTSTDELQTLRVQDLWVDPKRRVHQLARLAEASAVQDFEVEIKRPDGEIRTVLDTCYALHDPETDEVLFHGILIDITERKRTESRLLQLAERDPLTGTFNRRYLSQIERSAAKSPTPFGAIVVDVDNFKHYNDVHGHPAGDAILIELARFLGKHSRADDAVIRIGGDEFLVLLCGPNAAATDRVADRLREAAPRQAPAPFSLGWATRNGTEPLEETIARADAELIGVRIRERRNTGRLRRRVGD